MNINEQYDQWSETYDSQENKTRDLELESQIEFLNDYHFNDALEIGCGTGKNTAYLLKKSTNLTSVDFSEKMLEKAKEKFANTHGHFQLLDITKPWNLSTSNYDLISESLVFEHIQNLDFVFQQAYKFLKDGGIFYVSELHPFKQYAGSKARIQVNGSVENLTCFIHNLSDFTDAADKAGLQLIKIKEYFDNNDKNSIPRILSMLFKK